MQSSSQRPYRSPRGTAPRRQRSSSSSSSSSSSCGLHRIVAVVGTMLLALSVVPVWLVTRHERLQRRSVVLADDDDHRAEVGIVTNHRKKKRLGRLATSKAKEENPPRSSGRADTDQRVAGDAVRHAATNAAPKRSIQTATEGETRHANTTRETPRGRKPNTAPDDGRVGNDPSVAAPITVDHNDARQTNKKSAKTSQGHVQKLDTAPDDRPVENDPPVVAPIADNPTDARQTHENNAIKSQKHGQKPDTTHDDGRVQKDPSISMPITYNLNDARPTKEKKFLGRGVSGLPASQTPALIGAKRGHIQCDMNVDELAYWNDPQGQRDIEFKSPFVQETDKPKYVTFEPDPGGWNNIRMSLEIVFVFAAATGRTLVMPPEQPIYLLDVGSSSMDRGYFFPLENPEFKKRLKIISTEEFFRLEGGADGRFPIAPENREKVTAAAHSCVYMRKSDISCFAVYDHLRSVGFVPQISTDYCLVFDEGILHGDGLSEETQARVDEFCWKNKQVMYKSELHEEPLLHFQGDDIDNHRLLGHFYGFMMFTDPKIDNYYKRFVRDFLHYRDTIFCAAGKIVLSLQEDAKKLGFAVDDEGGGGYSSFHVRRGDLQYKDEKIPANEWYNNTKELIRPNEILYIATDEKNKTFFRPLADHYNLKFLDDFREDAGLDDIDPNYMGMIETIVASRGRIFVGTYFSTFSGYINRMRGYHGMTMKDSYYGTLTYKTITHTWGRISGNVCAREWSAGWVGIDGDRFATHDAF